MGSKTAALRSCERCFGWMEEDFFSLACIRKHITGDGKTREQWLAAGMASDTMESWKMPQKWWGKIECFLIDQRGIMGRRRAVPELR